MIGDLIIGLCLMGIMACSLAALQEEIYHRGWWKVIFRPLSGLIGLLFWLAAVGVALLRCAER
jgi:uncharacterized RDD family membrane protein YckC